MPRPKGPERATVSARPLMSTMPRLEEKAKAAGFKTVAAWMTDYFDSGKDEPTSPEWFKPSMTPVQRVRVPKPRTDVEPRFKKGTK